MVYLESNPGNTRGESVMPGGPARGGSPHRGCAHGQALALGCRDSVLLEGVGDGFKHASVSSQLVRSGRGLSWELRSLPLPDCLAQGERKATGGKLKVLRVGHCRKVWGDQAGSSQQLPQ